MADISYLKRVCSSDFIEDDRKRLFQEIFLTDTIGKDIRSVLQGKTFNIYGVPWDENWVTESAKYFGGKNRPNKSFDIDVYIIGPKISWSQMLNITKTTNVSITIKYEDLHWHLKKEFADYPSEDWELNSFIENKVEEIKQAKRQAKRLAKGIAQKDFLETLPSPSLNEDSLLSETFYIVGRVNESPWLLLCGTKQIQTHKDIHDIISEKGGNVTSKITKNISCVIYGSDVTVAKFKSFNEDTKFIDAKSFISWLAKAKTVDKDCRSFGAMYHSSHDFALRTYQQSAKDKIFIMWCKYRNVLLQMPTGTGKTILFTSIIRDLICVPDTKILILVHRKELIEQIDEHLNKYNITHGLIVTGRKRELSLSVQVASIQTITHKLNESLIKDINPSFIIIDEAHHSLAKTYTSFWKNCSKAWKLGVTATPYRLNNAPFSSLYSDILVSSPIKEFIDKGFLADYEFYTENPYHELTKAIESIKEKGQTGDYKIKTLIEKLNVDRHIQQLILCYLKYAKGLKGIVYAISIEHAQNICKAYKEIGVEAEFIDSHTPKTERAEIVQSFKNNEIQIMVNVEIFSEGFDCPDIDFIQMARPTWSLSLYLQQVGRGLRKNVEGKKTIILDNSNMFVHFGLPSERWDWIKHFSGDYDIPSIYEKYRRDNEFFLRTICEKSNELMFKLIPSQDWKNRPNIIKEHQNNLAKLKKVLTFKSNNNADSKSEEVGVNTFKSLSSNNVLSSPLKPAETPSELNYANKKPKPYKKRTYTEVYNESREETNKYKQNTTTLRKILACSLAALAVIATCIVVIAFAGAAVFFLPFLIGISKKK